MAFESADNYNAYCRYLNLRKQWQYHYQGVNLIDSIAIDLINATVANLPTTWYLVGTALTMRLKTDGLVRAFENVGVVFTYATKNRRDHEELSRMMQQSVENSTRYVLEFRYTPLVRPFLFLRHLRMVRKHVSTSFKNKCMLAARLTSYRSMIDELQKAFAGVNLEGKKYVPFLATAYQETLVALFMKSKGVTTFTTFHGYFGRYEKTIPNDVVNGANIITDYVLTFSEEQRNDLIRDFNIPLDKVFVAGQPKYPYRDIRFSREVKKILVLSGISFYDEAFKTLLPILERLAEEMKVTVDIRTHPRSQIQEADIKPYSHLRLLDKKTKLIEVLKTNGYDLAITHNTSSYYECIYHNIRPLRYQVGENVSFEALTDGFATYEQLTDLLSLKVEGNEYTQLLVRVYGMGINNYNQIIANV